MKKKKLKWYDELPKPLWMVLILAIIFRIWLQVKTPLILQGGASYDDFLLVKYAQSIIEGSYLGSFNVLTLAKTLSFSYYLIFVYLTGLSYSLLLILLYICAILLLIKALKPLVKSKYFSFGLYLFLLYSPVMFHEENVQKVYRGGVIVCFAIIVIAAFIGIFTRYKNSKSLAKWSILGALSLSFFYFLKEDAIWIIPYVMLMCIFTIYFICKHSHKFEFKKIILVILPIIVLVGVKNISCFINYSYYGEYAITDRSGTYFKDAMHDILQIKDDKKDKDVWISKKMLIDATNNSKTLHKDKKALLKMYDNPWAVTDGEIPGDMIYWKIKDTLSNQGHYKSGKQINNYYKKVHDELTGSFKKGKLKKSDEIYVSSIARGFTKNDIGSIIGDFNKGVINGVIYKENITVLKASSGPRENIILMDKFTNSNMILPSSKIYGTHQRVIDIDNFITKLYQVTGLVIFVVALTSFALSIVFQIKDRHIEKFTLIAISLILSSGALIFGVTYFCNFLSERKVYDYIGGFIPILQILEAYYIYYLIKTVKKVKRDKI